MRSVLISDDNSSGVEEETLTEGLESKSMKSRFGLPRSLLGLGQMARCFKAPSIDIEVPKLKYEEPKLLS